jgi:hypothetical protein
VAHFHDVHRLGNTWRAFGAALTADHLTAGQKVIRTIAFALIFTLIAMPLLLDLLR